MKDQDNRVLIHSCCAICSGYPIKMLKDLGYEPVSYFYNPNIYPKTEYDKRLIAQKILCDELGCELIVENYDADLYNEIMVDYQEYKEGSERCKKCFELRLLKSVEKAKALGIENFTTSISISPHKNFKWIKEIGDELEKSSGIKFLDFDFKKQDGFLKTNKISRELGLYRQNYCGCEMSMGWLQNQKIK